jgi:hypothetical protein
MLAQTVQQVAANNNSNPAVECTITYCTTHPSKKIKFFCKNDSETFCSKCILKHTQQKHDVVNCSPKSKFLFECNTTCSCGYEAYGLGTSNGGWNSRIRNTCKRGTLQQVGAESKEKVQWGDWPSRKVLPENNGTTRYLVTEPLPNDEGANWQGNQITLRKKEKTQGAWSRHCWTESRLEPTTQESGAVQLWSEFQFVLREKEARHRCLADFKWVCKAEPLLFILHV